MSQLTPGGTGESSTCLMDGRRLKHRPLRHVNLADHAVVEQLNCLDLVRHAAALRPDLHHAARFARHFDHALALVDVVAGGLFAVDVLARLAGPDGGKRVPVVGGGDGDRVHILVREKLAHVVVTLGLFPGQLLGGGLSGFERGLVDVAQRHDTRIRQRGVALDVIVAASADADDADVEFVIGAEHTAQGKCGSWPR